MENPPTSLTVLALQAAVLRQQMSENYVNLLKSKIFLNKKIRDKESLKYQRTLLGEEANKVLDILWKESSFVSQAELLAAGYSQKIFAAGVTSHALGVRLAENAMQVAATVTRVRNIVIASCEYGLLSKQQLHSKNSIILCTLFLHNFMTELGTQNSVAISRMVPAFSHAISCAQETAEPLLEH